MRPALRPHKRDRWSRGGSITFSTASAHVSKENAESCPDSWAALSSLQECLHARDRVGIAFQAVRILFGLQFNLQPDAVRIGEVEGLAVPPFNNVGHGDAMVSEPLVGGVEFLKRVHR